MCKYIYIHIQCANLYLNVQIHIHTYPYRLYIYIINRAITIPRNELLNKIKTSNTERLPLTVTYNRTLPDLKTIIDKNWHILQIQPKLKEIFAEPPILAFKRNKNLRDIIRGNKLFDNKRILNVKKFNHLREMPTIFHQIN